MDRQNKIWGVSGYIDDFERKMTAVNKGSSEGGMHPPILIPTQPYQNSCASANTGKYPSHNLQLQPLAKQPNFGR